MILPDVNVLLYAYRSEAREHPLHAAWLNKLIKSGEPYGISPQVLSSVVRIITNRKLFKGQYALQDVLDFCDALISRPNCEIVQPGPSHWEIFCNLCRSCEARGDTVQDAWLAALAIEHNCEWITHDLDFTRFPGLRWRTPF